MKKVLVTIAAGLLGAAVLKGFSGEPKNVSDEAIEAMRAIAQPTATGKVFALNAKLEKLWGEGSFTEGVASAPDGAVYFCDVAMSGTPDRELGYIHKYDPKTGRVTLFRSPSGCSNGMKFSASGEMFTAQVNNGGFRNILRTDMQTGKAYVYASRYNNKPFNSPNDLVFDNLGRLYFTDSRYAGDEPLEQPFFGVFRVDTDRKVTPIIIGLLSPNGIAISPDQKTLYVVEHAYSNTDLGRHRGTIRAMTINAYDLSAAGEATLRKTFVDYGQTEGADGLVVDTEGNVYAAARDSKRMGIRVYSAAGEEIDSLALPENPTNMSFGRGAERGTLYITAGKSLYRVGTGKVGWEVGGVGGK